MVSPPKIVIHAPKRLFAEMARRKYAIPKQACIIIPSHEIGHVDQGLPGWYPRLWPDPTGEYEKSEVEKMICIYYQLKGRANKDKMLDNIHRKLEEMDVDGAGRQKV